MAEEKKTNDYKLRVIGPADENNGAEALRFKRDGRRKDIVLVPGQIITVSDSNGDLTQSEADRLKSTTTWKF